MTQAIKPTAPRFRVRVRRVSGQLAVAEAHGQTMELAIKGGDPALGFTAPETLLAAFGACILSNVTRNAAEMGLRVDAVEVAFDGVKRAQPLGIDPLGYRVSIQSGEPEEALRELYRRATSDGTATNALLRGLSPVGVLVVERDDPDEPGDVRLASPEGTHVGSPVPSAVRPRAGRASRTAAPWTSPPALPTARPPRKPTRPARG